MPEQTYNGWSNYETWAVNLWLTNDEPSYLYWTEAARDVVRTVAEGVYMYGAHATLTAAERARLNLAERLQSELEESAPDLGASVWADLLNAAIGRVDWYEIAGNMLTEYTEK